MFLFKQDDCLYGKIKINSMYDTGTKITELFIIAEGNLETTYIILKRYLLTTIIINSLIRQLYIIEN